MTSSRKGFGFLSVGLPARLFPVLKSGNATADRGLETGMVSVAGPVVRQASNVTFCVYDQLKPPFPDTGKFCPVAFKMLSRSVVRTKPYSLGSDTNWPHAEMFLPGVS